jgi:hypothetical protein
VLREYNVEVIEPAGLSSPSSFQTTAGQPDSADVAIFLNNGRIDSWVDREINRLRSLDIDIIPVVLSSSVRMEDLQSRGLFNPVRPSRIDARSIAETVLKLMPSLA